MCNHPASSLKPDSAEQSNGTVTIRFCCQSCLAPITKQFMLTMPEAAPSFIDELQAASEPVAAVTAPKARRGANSPWRHFPAMS